MPPWPPLEGVAWQGPGRKGIGYFLFTEHSSVPRGAQVHVPPRKFQHFPETEESQPKRAQSSVPQLRG